MRPIADVAEELGLPASALVPHGRYMAKVPFNAFGARNPAESKLVVVTAMTPTPAGEGKTTTSIGLTQGLAKIGKKPLLTLREPSVGPVFGSKGGGTGGGNARIVPDEEINLAFTGDFYRIQMAHNLLAALTDRAAHGGDIEGFKPSGVVWRRVTDIPDRALRQIKQGLCGSAEARYRQNPNGPARQSGFDLVSASEIMAIMALAHDLADLRERLSRVVVGFGGSGEPVTAQDVGAVGPMMVLLRDAMNPNLVQTLEGQPALVHTGPFGNIAHGCSSVVADRLGMTLGDFVVTEAGFGADLGFEKFMHIKTRASGLVPSAVVIVATARAVRWHGGTDNLSHAINIVGQFGLPAIVAVNRFPDDTAEEISAIKAASNAAAPFPAFCVENFGYESGGKGAQDLARAVVYMADFVSAGKKYRATGLYGLSSTSIEEKAEILARRVYLAEGVRWGNPKNEKQVKRLALQLKRFKRAGWDNLPICVAKTHMSISGNPKLRGRPEGHSITITDARISAGAGFVYLLAGNIPTLPGLQADANAFGMDIDEEGNITGVL